ncbi:MAG: AAA family ATPase, partial [Lachnospiraceae bacterium]
MGIYVNPGNRLFKEAVNSPIYVDKSRLIDYTNSVLNTQRKNICTSRPRRFGKSMAADMLSAYYSKGCDSEDIFSKLEISHENKTVSAKDPEQEAKRIEAYRVNLNRHNVIRFDVQRFLFDESHVWYYVKKKYKLKVNFSYNLPFFIQPI